MTSTPSEKSPRPSRGSAELAGDDAPKVTRGHLVAILVATAAFVWLVGAVHPFSALQSWAQGDGETVRMQPVHFDPAACDVQVGADLQKTFAALPPARGRKRVVFFGNSQQYTSSLPKGGAIVPNHEVEMASAQLGERLERRAPGKLSVYAAAAPNQNFIEELWQGLYWFHVLEEKPTAIFIQSSFDTYRKLGIRAGFQTLLGDPRFASALDGLLSSPKRSYHDEMRAARRDREQRLQEIGAEHKDSESRLRDGLAHIPAFRDREKERGAFLDLLYHARVRALGISPTTKRHIAGEAMRENMDALEDLVAMARRSGASVFIYNAPVNPAVSMFYDDEYQAYLVAIQALAAKHGASYVDLADAVRPEDWGYWIDGPDPIHFSEPGHRMLAERLDAEFGEALTKEARP